MYQEYTLRKHLKKLCEENPQYKELDAIVEIEINELKKILSTIIYNYPHYSMHDDTHSETIISNIESFIGEENIMKLQPTETWMLIMSAYYHDIGMSIVYENIEKEFMNDEFEKYLKESLENSYVENEEQKKRVLKIIRALKTKEKIDDFDYKLLLRFRNDLVIIISEYYRKKHADMSSEYMHGSTHCCINLINNIKPRISIMLGKICQLHQKNFEDVINELPQMCDGIKKDKIHPRFIACMLRIGDLLDLDNGRFNKSLGKVFGDTPYLSKIHDYKHEAIRELLITNRKIEIGADCKNAEVYRELVRWIDWLEDEIKNISYRYNEIMPEEFKMTIPKLKINEIRIDGDVIRKENSSLKLELDLYDVYDMLEGGGIYKDKFVFVRELLQNAIDATKIQIFKNIEDGLITLNNGVSIEELNDAPYGLEEVFKSYAVDINIRTEEDKKEEFYVVFEITDKGTGIREQDLKNICKINKNHKKDIDREIIERMPYYLKPTRAFGLGLQSCFLVTDEIIFITKPLNEEEKEITMVSGKKGGYVTTKKSNKLKHFGTKTIIKISKSKIEELFKIENFNSINNKTKYYLNLVFNNIYEEVFGKKYNNQNNRVNELFWNIYGIKIEMKCNEIDDFKEVIESVNIGEKKQNSLYDYEMIDKKLIILDKINKFWIELIPNIKEYSTPKVYFKNILVGNDNISYRLNNSDWIFKIPFFQVKINILDGDAKKILTISRDDIRSECIEYFINKKEIFKNKILKSIFEFIYIKEKNLNEFDKMDKLQFAANYNYYMLNKNNNYWLKNRVVNNIEDKEEIEITAFLNGESNAENIFKSDIEKIYMIQEKDHSKPIRKNKFKELSDNYKTYIFADLSLQNYFAKIYDNMEWQFEKLKIEDNTYEEYGGVCINKNKISLYNKNYIIDSIRRTAKNSINKFYEITGYLYLEVARYTTELNIIKIEDKIYLPFYYIGKDQRNDFKIIEEIKKADENIAKNIIRKNINTYINENIINEIIETNNVYRDEIVEVYTDIIYEVYKLEKEEENN